MRWNGLDWLLAGFLMAVAFLCGAFLLEIFDWIAAR
jgi:hypothetical protein